MVDLLKFFSIFRKWTIAPSVSLNPPAIVLNDMQSCQLSRIDRETHAFHHILTLSQWYKNISHIFFFPCQRFVMYEGYPYYMCLQIRGKNFEVGKKKCLSSPRSSAFLGLARLYRLAADGPSHISLQTLIQCWQPWTCYNVINWYGTQQ